MATNHDNMPKRRGVASKVGPHEKKVWMRVGLGALASVVVVVIVLYAGDDDIVPSDADATVQHIHGMAVDPQDPTNLYLATHHGLFRGDADMGWRRVGDVQDDLMGFTIDSEGRRLWSSGHPVGGGNMGVRVSEDGGNSWEYQALKGVDFHAMTLSAVDDDTMWGMFQGKVYESLDAGRSWDTVGAVTPGTVALIPDPVDEQTLYAAGQQGVARSTDGGRSWTLWLDQVTTHLAFPGEGTQDVLRIGPDGMHRSMDGGVNWTNVGTAFGGVPSLVAVHPDDPGTWYVATFSDQVYKTSDAGTTWTKVLGE